MLKNSLYHTKYLCTCDLINKYTLLNLDALPRIESIEVRISLSKLIDQQNDYDDLNLKIRSFIIFFLYTFKFPFLKYNKIMQNSKIESAINGKDFDFSIKFSNKTKIHHFLISFFLENSGLIGSNAVLIKKLFPKKLNQLQASLGILFLNLYGMDYLTNSNIFFLNTKDLEFSLNVLLIKRGTGDKEAFLKNLFPFWLI